ncbi:MAG: T9SS type A sorting domain-containing protein, partial [Bacteroidota bacterium]|nr:T9SS type A sorting domain-containing protein [Bacteroidota bacterium]
TYQLPKKSFVRLELYNLIGAKIATLVNDTQETGVHNAVFAASTYNLASGIYFYKLSAGNFIAVKKMTYLK